MGEVKLDLSPTNKAVDMFTSIVSEGANEIERRLPEMGHCYKKIGSQYDLPRKKLTEEEESIIDKLKRRRREEKSNCIVKDTQRNRERLEFLKREIVLKNM